MKGVRKADGKAVENAPQRVYIIYQLANPNRIGLIGKYTTI